MLSSFGTGENSKIEYDSLGIPWVNFKNKGFEFLEQLSINDCVKFFNNNEQLFLKLPLYIKKYIELYKFNAN